MTTSIPAILIPGDGIGPEITAATLSVLSRLGAPFVWETCDAGLKAFEAGGTALPQRTLDGIRGTGLALKGPLATPSSGGYRSANVTLRETFDLFANVRPARTIVPGRFENVDVILVRENIEGMYAAQESYLPDGDDPNGIAIATGRNTRAECRRILRFAFDLAVSQGRRKVTVVHKANILKILSGIFLETAKEIAPEYDGKVAFEERIVDACAMQLVVDPSRFDVIVTTNLFGDILSDLIAGLVGGLGLVAGANVGERAAIFEAVHGTAPDIAGRGIANPTAIMMAAAMMLDHVGRMDLGDRLRVAIEATLLAGERTGDLGGKLGTKDFAQAVGSRL